MRYLLLLLLNTPIIALALLNIVTKYKLGKMTAKRYRFQIFVWLSMLLVISGSFPLYNYLVGQPPLESISLSSFDIIEITAIVFLFYIMNNLRQKQEQNDRRLRELNQELSIRLSEKPER